jgi:transposase InsO family protein
MRASSDVSVLRSAYLQGYAAQGAISRSDTGSPYASKEYAGFAVDHDIRLSVGRTGMCWDKGKRACNVAAGSGGYKHLSKARDNPDSKQNDDNG